MGNQAEAGRHVPQRQAPDRPGRDLHVEPHRVERVQRHDPPGPHRHQEHQGHRHAHRAGQDDQAVQQLRDPARGVVGLPLHRPGRLRSGQASRDRAVHVQELQLGPAQPVHPEPALLEERAAARGHPGDHRLRQHGVAGRCLQTGVIHAAGTLDGPQMATLDNASSVKAVPSKGGGIVPFTMRVDVPPFHDVRVRQALRLLVDRAQLIDSALDGHGTLAYDVFSPFDRDFDTRLVRHTDVAHAKFLLKQAGQENLTVTLTTSQIATGTVAMATVLAEQAKVAGVKINVSNVPSGTFFGKQYLSWPFAQDYYNYFPYMAQIAESMLSGSPFNETHTNNPAYTKLYNQANATASGSSLEQELLYEMQTFDFNEGGYIIPAYVDALDAYSTKIAGFRSARIGQPLSNFDMEHWYFI